MDSRVAPPPNRREFAIPTTPEVLEAAFVRSLLERHGRKGGRLKLSATSARLLLGHLRSYAYCLTPEDRELEVDLRAFTDEWDKVQRGAWHALTFHKARARRPLPARVEDRRWEPQAREARPSRRVRTSATARGSPSSRSSSGDSEPPLARPTARRSA